ncbi:glycosyltransferase family 4 protein [Pseudoalteromonas luteoviolacea]|uniref:glycosyltransferase family 4 protein n=1 Tax=Pseudoalteromonas luteoviolacea TaxID=43657 RepID=UPI001B37249D|nr:glycosyltransferase family 4 protein [Pseudoalteromonas luteoviolacea]MBQ4810856.1 glycosyltransferase family 4 protein [Pseudoalteromonas luteoviolacea]
MTKVLVIGYVWPEPNSSAAGVHMMSLLKFYKSQGWQVEFASPAQITEHMVDLSEYEISSKQIALNCSSFDEYIQQYEPDIVMFDRFMMEEQFGWRVDKFAPNAMKILDTEDLQSLRGARHESIKANEAFHESKLLNSELAKREIAAILRCDLSLIISDFELELLKQTFNISEALLVHLPFLVDLSKLQLDRPSFDERQHFMTIGNFRHAPNWDSVLYLQRLWPAIKKRVPDAELHIYGSYPPKKATALNNPKTGFFVKGWAEDAIEVMSQSRVCLSPIRFGAGIKGKLLEAMLTQTPCVTTPVGAEGMHGSLPWHGCVAQSDEEFVDAAVALYTDKALFEKAQKNGLAILQARYDQVSLIERLQHKIAHTRNALVQHRTNNFYGQMLKHHTLRSTQYMSQWIEEKNANKMR